MQRIPMVRGAALALLCALPFTGAHAQDAAADARAAVEACVRDNAPRVEQAFESLIEATTFLVGSVCAKPIADLEEIARQAQDARRRERLDEMCAGVEDPDPFDPIASERAARCESREFMDLYTGGYYDGYSTIVRVASGAADAETVSLAATLLLEARLARRAAAP